MEKALQRWQTASQRGQNVRLWEATRMRVGGNSNKKHVWERLLEDVYGLLEK